jgi:ribosomal protein L20
VKRGKHSIKFVLSGKDIRYHKLPDTPKIKSVLNISTGEWGSFNRCQKCRHLFSSTTVQEYYCKDCKKKKAREHVFITRINIKMKKWREDGLSSEEIIRRVSAEVRRHNKKPDGMIKCERCGRPFKGVRAKYCNTCKVAVWREKEKQSTCI